MHLRSAMATVSNVEFIFQLNDKTLPLYNVLSVDPPTNMSVLFDTSCGTGVELTALPTPPANVRCGYAGGIGPSNIRKILSMVADIDQSNRAISVWIDMESSLRVMTQSCNGQQEMLTLDTFSIDKCFACVTECVNAGLPVKRNDKSSDICSIGTH